MDSPPPCREIDHQRTAVAAQHACCRHVFFPDVAPVGVERCMPPDIETAIALEAIFLAVDLRKVMPDTQQVAVIVMIDEFEDARVGL